MEVVLKPEPDFGINQKTNNSSGRTKIGLLRESSLHKALKNYYSTPDDHMEVPLRGYIIDIERKNGELLEIQTTSLNSLKDKVFALCPEYRLHIVYPVISEKTILYTDVHTKKSCKSRKSPKRGDLWSIFDELVKAPWIVSFRNLVFEVAFISINEKRINDGMGSWRRKGVSILDKELKTISGCKVFSELNNWIELLPKNSSGIWTSASLGKALAIKSGQARKILYVFNKAGIICKNGKSGRMTQYIIEDNFRQ